MNQPLRIHTFICAALLILAVSQFANASPLEMMADIQQPVVTEFGQYMPRFIEIEPSVEPYFIAEDFSNIANFNQFSFTDEQKELLRRNGFVAVPGSYKEMYEIYNDALENNLPVFVTVDALLHAFHEQFDFILRTLEAETFSGQLIELTQALIDASLLQLEQASGPNVAEAVQNNIVYFSVAAKCLQKDFSIPESAAGLVNLELKKIESHSGISNSPLFGYSEDYTQYIPRGHYTLSETLTNYFKAMMWFGRMTFHNQENEMIGITLPMAERQSLQALLITQLMNTVTVGGQSVLQIWERIYYPTVFFVGQSDDLTLYDYTAAAHAVYGENFASLPVDELGDSAKLDEFMNYPFRQASRISPEIWGAGYRFMGQRFIPDSYIFNELYAGIGGIPSGLEIMAVFGSERAKDILSQNGNYHEGHDELHAEFAALEDSVWAQNVYWNWLYCLMPVIALKGEGFPTFMQSPAWRDKDLACALGSWAELRHDTILYAKQSYAAGGMHEISNAYDREYVEPNPWAFARLASLCQYLHEGLDNLDLLNERFENRLTQLGSLVESLQVIAAKELAGVSISVAERRLIRTIGQPLTLLSINEEEVNDHTADWIEDDMAVIADVHTDPYMELCLEVGVGHPLSIYVVTGQGDNLSIACGSAFAYHEFAQPISDRLTDEAWIEMLEQSQQPAQPEWVGNYVDLANSMTQTGRVIAPEHGMQFFRYDVTVSSGRINAGDSLTVHIRFEIDYPDYTSFDPGQNLYRAEIVMDNRIIDAELQADTSTDDPNDFFVSFQTSSWPSGDYAVSVYCTGNLGIFQTMGFSVEGTSGVGSWYLY